MIEFKHVSKSFGKKSVLDDVSFQVADGEIVFVIGRSGTGKSVLLRHLVGLLNPDRGEIWFDGENITHFSEKDFFGVRRKCGLVFQQPSLLDSLTVYENVAFGPKVHRMYANEAEYEKEMIQTLDLVGLKPSVLSRYPSELSFGMQKRVGLARTLSLKPKCLLYDEPTTGLDPVTTRAINSLIADLAKRLKTTSVVVSHDMQCALEVADRILMLDRGKIVADGTVAELMNSQVGLVALFLREAKERLGQVRA